MFFAKTEDFICFYDKKFVLLSDRESNWGANWNRRFRFGNPKSTVTIVGASSLAFYATVLLDPLERI